MSTQIELLKKYSISVRGHLGQHLLIDPNVARKIVDLLNPSPKDSILEIGPGLGALTRALTERGCRVHAIEKDKRFVDVLEKEWGGSKQLQITQGDILELDFKKILGIKKSSKKKVKVISNLPYYITAPILIKLLEARDLISMAVLTMQREVAKRIIASPGTKDYGRLTLAVRFGANVKHAFDISPRCFTPQPEVVSSVMVFDFFEKPESVTVDEDFLFYLIQQAFSQRRKTLLHLLVHAEKIEAGRERLLGIFQDLGWTASVRGEELLLKDYLALGEALQKER